MHLNRLASRSHTTELGQLNAGEYEHCAAIAKPAQSNDHAEDDGGAAATIAWTVEAKVETAATIKEHWFEL